MIAGNHWSHGSGTSRSAITINANAMNVTRPLTPVMINSASMAIGKNTIRQIL